MRASLSDRILLGLVGLVGRLLSLLNRGLLVALTRLAAWLVYGLGGKRRRVAHENLQLAFGDQYSHAQRRRLAIDSYQSFLMVIADTACSHSHSSEWLRRVVSVGSEGEELLWRLHSQGRGVIAVLSHHGNWEVMGEFGSAISRLPLAVLANHLDNDAMDGFIERMRTRHGTRVIYKENAARGILSALRRGEIVCLLLDQNTRPDRGGIYVPFFGLDVSVSRAVSTFALRGRVPVIMASGLPERGGRRYRITFGPEVPLPDLDGCEDPEREMTARCLAAIEKQVRDRPDCWQWSYKRWRFRPQQELGRYPSYSKPLPASADGLRSESV